MWKLPKFRFFALITVAILLAGCEAATLAITKRELDVETKMTNSVFLEPTFADNRLVFVQIRNTSDRLDFDIEPQIKSAIFARGYSVVDDPDVANFLLQANVLQVGETDPTAAEQAYLGGYGSVIGGAAAGGAIGKAFDSYEPANVAIGSLLGAGIAAIANASVKDVTYSVITDIQVSERAKSGVMVRADMKHTLQQGASGGSVYQAAEVTEWKRYQTRIVSTANKANLEFEEASPHLVNGLVRSISGIF